MQIITDYRLTFAADENSQVTIVLPQYGSLICRNDGTLTYTSEDSFVLVNANLHALKYIDTALPRGPLPDYIRSDK